MKDKILNQLILVTREFLNLYLDFGVRRFEANGENNVWDLRLKINKKYLLSGEKKAVLVIEALGFDPSYQKKGICTEYFKRLPSLLDGQKIIGVEVEAVLHEFLERTLKNVGYSNAEWRPDVFYKEAELGG